jgi:hypothetical protein
MKFLAIALAYEEERFVKGYPPKGANLFMAPNLEISQLASLLSKRDELIYLDERFDCLSQSREVLQTTDLVLIFADFGQEKRAMELVAQLSADGKRSIIFGPLPTAWHSALGGLPDWVDTVVIGSIVNAYSEIREDLAHGKLKKQYVAEDQPVYIPSTASIHLKTNSGSFNKTLQPLQAVIGCFCLPQIKPICPQNLYYGSKVLKRDLIEVIGEIISLPYKHIILLDEDITQYPDYYYDFFTHAWNYRKHWTVQAGKRFFENPNFIRLLAKAGTRIIFLNEDWFPPLFPGVITAADAEFPNSASSTQAILREKRRQVKMIHSERILVGAKLSLVYYPTSEFDFNNAFRLIDRLDLDFIAIKFFEPAPPESGFGILPIQRRYFPMLPSTDPAWLKNRFYALGHIIYRAGIRPASIGFYNTLFYLIPYSLAYRQNFLEGIAYPP